MKLGTRDFLHVKIKYVFFLTEISAICDPYVSIFNFYTQKNDKKIDYFSKRSANIFFMTCMTMKINMDSL